MTIRFRRVGDMHSREIDRCTTRSTVSSTGFSVVRMPSQVQQDIHSKLARLGEDANDSNFQGSRFRARISNT